MTTEQRLERLERENRWMRRIGAVAVALLIGCASSDSDFSGLGASWEPGVDEIPAIADRLATYDTLVVGAFDTETDDITTSAAARTFRWLLGAEFEGLAVYPTVARAAASDVMAVLVRGTIHFVRRNPPGKTPKCVLEATIRVSDAHTGEVLCSRHIASSVTGATGFEHPEALWQAATDVAHWLYALKEGRRPFIGELRYPEYAAAQ